MTSAISSFGTLLKIGDGGATESFTTIAEVKDIDGPSLEQGTEEVTTHSSTAGWREFIGTLLDGGEITFDVNLIIAGATHDASTGLIADLVAKTVRNFQLVFPDDATTTWEFAALVTSFAIGAPVEGGLGASITLKLTGQPTLT